MKFEEGQEVKALYWNDEYGSLLRVGDNGIERITVAYENGQMALVAWFEVWKDGKITAKHNAAHIATVDL